MTSSITFARLILLFLIVATTVTAQGGHGHSHDHGDHGHGGHGHDHHGHAHHHDHEEPPSFRYSREANEAAQKKEPTRKVEPTKKKVEPTKKKVDPVGSRASQSVEEMWLHALLSTVAISLAPFLILFFVPLDNSEEKRPHLKVLLSFASGGLLGDAFLHLIPHALMAQGGSEDHGHSHSHSHGHGEDGHHEPHDMTVGLWVLAGILAFLVVEKFVRIIKGSGHGHSHGPVPVKKAEKKKEKESDDEDESDTKVEAVNEEG